MNFGFLKKWFGRAANRQTSKLIQRFEALEKTLPFGETKGADFQGLLDSFIAEGGDFNPLATSQYGQTEAMKIAIRLQYPGLKKAVEHGLRFSPAAIAFGESSEASHMKFDDGKSLRLYADNIMEGYEGPIYTNVPNSTDQTLLMQLMTLPNAKTLQAYYETGGSFNPKARDDQGMSEAMYLARVDWCSFSAEDVKRGRLPDGTQVPVTKVIAGIDENTDIGVLKRSIQDEALKVLGPQSSPFGVHAIQMMAIYTPEIQDVYADFFKKIGEKMVVPITPDNNENLKNAEAFRYFLEQGGQLNPNDEIEIACFLQHSNPVIRKLYNAWFLENDYVLPAAPRGLQPTLGGG